jgi:hypothetical protein
MNITYSLLEQLIEKDENKKPSEIRSFNLNNMNITNFLLNEATFTSIEYLSLQNNLLKNTTFLKHFPNLWYLDIRSNQVRRNNNIYK